MSDDVEYEEELRIVRRKKGTSRSKSSKSSEFESDLLWNQDSKVVAGPTESRAVDEAELRRMCEAHDFGGGVKNSDSQFESPSLRDASIDAVATLVVDGLIVPLVKELIVPGVTQVVIPRTRDKLSEWAEHRRARRIEKAEATLRSADARGLRSRHPTSGPVASSEIPALVEPTIPMSRRDLLLARLRLKLAEDYVAQQRWLIGHAEVTENDIQEEGSAVQELVRSIQQILEGNIDQLDEHQRALIAELLSDQLECREEGEPIEIEATAKVGDHNSGS